MARNFRELEAKMSPRALSRSDAKSAKLIREMALKELRRAMGITQEQLARALRINQAGVSKIESRSDIFVSTLRKAIEALGGELEIRARFSTGEVKIKHFGAIRRVSRRRRSKAA
ncbi:MAG TPA: helix-turn-helix transcriptional regulator [Candidatus Angelobacter sp.]|nr:helix-turn-helix transcriptional regulator [Candidatus Angelobacter sp.]